MAFGMIIITALIAFEIFNYSTTDFALTDLLGDLKFLGIRWATILSIAFCGIDFAGIARLFTPDATSGDGSPGHSEAWYLFGAWLLAATMNAMLTWWGVSLAVLGHETLGNTVVSRETLLRVVPIFVAILVWLIRVLIIGTFSVAGDRLFNQDEPRVIVRQRDYPRVASRPTQVRSLGSGPQRRPPARAASKTNRSPAYRPAPKPPRQADPAYDNSEPSYSRPEPTYHPLSASAPKNSQNAASPTASARRSRSQLR
jgi:hypothetical protein